MFVLVCLRVFFLQGRQVEWSSNHSITAIYKLMDVFLSLLICCDKEFFPLWSEHQVSVFVSARVCVCTLERKSKRLRGLKWEGSTIEHV